MKGEPMTTLTDAMEGFTSNYSTNTARTYGNGLKRFLAWAKETGIPVAGVGDINPKWVIPFAQSLKREGLSPRSVETYMTALIRFLRWLKREEIANISADALLVLQEKMKEWRRNNKVQMLPRLPQEKAVTVTMKMAHEFDAEDDRSKLYHLRNAAFIEFLASTACRISEATNMKRADLVPDQMGAWVRSGKGRKDRFAVFDSQEAWDTLQLYLAERDRARLRATGEEPLFARHDKAAHARGELLPISTNSMRNAWDRMIAEAEVAHFTPHQLRHRAATDLYRKTGDIAIVQKRLGHANISTTAGTYMHLNNQDLIKAVRGG
jgi:site-specific recombinase XerD